MILSMLMIYDVQHETVVGVRRVINAIVIWQALLFGTINVLSIFHAITKSNILISYSMVCIAIFFYKLKRKRKYNYRLKERIGELDKRTWMLLVLFCIPLIASIIYVPYNWDSMTYHLARIVNWEQFQSIEHYATGNDRQVASPVLPAYNNLFVYVITNQSVRLLNLQQCIAYGINAYMVYQIARKIEVKKNYAYVGALLFMTAPIALAEAMTTQVDHLSTMYLLFFVYLVLGFIRTKECLSWNKSTVETIVVMAACIAFSYLSKPSTGFGILVFLVALLIACIRRKDRIIELIKMAVVALAVIVIPLSFDWIRNYLSFGSISIDQVGSRQLIGTLKPNYVFINLLKNFTHNIFPILNENYQGLMVSILTKISNFLGVAINDPTISEDGRMFGYSSVGTYGCDTAPNYILVIILCFCLLLLPFVYRKMTRIQRQVSMASIVSFLLFCMVLRWEPFVTRYMISYFAMVCVAVVVILQKGEELEFLNGKIAIVQAVVLFSLTSLFFQTMYIYNSSIVDEEGYFKIGQWELGVQYRAATDYIKEQDYGNIGIALGVDTYEFPLWRMLLEDEYEIRHVMVESGLSQYESVEFIPDCVIIANRGINTQELQYNGKTFLKNAEIVGGGLGFMS